MRRGLRDPVPFLVGVGSGFVGRTPRLRMYCDYLAPACSKQAG